MITFRKVVRHYRCRRIGIILALVMALPASEARDVPRFNQGLSSSNGASNSVLCTDGFLSVQAQAVTLAELLDEVARQCGLTVVWYVSLEERVSVAFQKLSLTQGLQRILRNRSHVLMSTPTRLGSRQTTLVNTQTLWILPQGEEKYSARPSLAGTTGSFLSNEDALNISRLGAALSNGNLEHREQAAMALGKRGQTLAIAPLSQALADKGDEVRDAAVLSLAKIGGADATRALAVALRDRDPHIREQAVNALGEDGGAIATGLLQQALMDDVAFVRQAATEILQQLASQTP